jgi:hypothetical protein
MKDFMLRILNRGDHQTAWSAERHREFVRRCETYIDGLRRDGRLQAAQPLLRNGAVLSRNNGDWNIALLNTNEEIQVGYYHVRVENLDEAIEIAKGNPEFEFSTTARNEVRLLKAEEDSTGFVYPR